MCLCVHLGPSGHPTPTPPIDRVSLCSLWPTGKSKQARENSEAVLAVHRVSTKTTMLGTLINTFNMKYSFRLNENLFFFFQINTSQPNSIVFYGKKKFMLSLFFFFL